MGPSHGCPRSRAATWQGWWTTPLQDLPLSRKGRPQSRVCAGQWRQEGARWPPYACVIAATLLASASPPHCGTVHWGLQGDHVLACSDSFLPHIAAGTYAELASVREGHLAPMPAGLSFEEAAVVPLVALTAWQVGYAGAQPGAMHKCPTAGLQLEACCLQSAFLHPLFLRPLVYTQHALRIAAHPCCRPWTASTSPPAAASWCTAEAVGWAAWRCSWPSCEAGT